MLPTPRRRGRRARRLGILRTLERLSDDQVLFCTCGDPHAATTCGG